MNRIIFSLFLILILFVSCEKNQNQNITFLVANDMGRRGESEQQNIANLMSLHAELEKVKFLAVAGDPIHDEGVTGLDDEEWNLKIENIYTSRSLHAIPWYVISGNHEYHGNVQAILDYSNISERWNAPARYFSMEYPVGKKQKVLFVYIDTPPLIDKYRETYENEEDNYSDAGEQNIENQLFWLDSTLLASKCKWKIVIGHHPIYADTEKSENERIDMQKRVGSILENHNVDFYICGHIHNFQYIKPEGKKVNYIVNSSASRSRVAKPIEGTLFCNPDPGYSAFTVSADSIWFSFVNHKGEQVYKHAIGKGVE